ncbi:MAG: NFACT family protein [Desulfurococcales archaeon]|nr:NFACT family protein [Desulfurococcales archaeon]
MARRSMNILDLSVVTSRWSVLEGRRIDNIYYDGGDMVLVKVKPGQEVLLVGEAGRRFHATRRLRPPQDFKPHPLIVTLRREMRGARIRRVELLGGDRIVVLEASTGHRLVVEVLPRGAILHLDPEGRIIAASRYGSFRDRRIAPKEEYRAPPRAGPRLEELDVDAIHRSLEGQKDLVRGLVRGAGIPGEVAEEAIHRAGLDPGMRPEDLKHGDLEALVEAINGIWRESLQGAGYLIRDGQGNPVEADPFKPTKAPEDLVERLDEFDDALDTLYAAQHRRVEAEDERGRLERSLEEARRRARMYREKAMEYRRIATLIPQEYSKYSQLLECIRRRRDCGEAVEWSGGRAFITVDGVRVEVKPGETVDQLVIRLFKEAGELEAKARRAEEAGLDIEKRLEELEVRVRARRLLEKARRRRKGWYERYHWTITRNGILVVAGRDAGQNESLVRRYLGEEDIFMHADIHGAPAVIVKTGKKEPGIEDLSDAAVIAAAYSRAWKAGLGSVQVYWVRGSQVSKSPPSGEYLARGGFIIRGKRNYLPPVPVRIYIGVALDGEGAPVVVAGAREPLARYTVSYVRIDPGDTGLEELARRVREALRKPLPRSEHYIPMGLPEEEVLQRLPGRGRILGSWRGEGAGLPYIDG